METIKTIRDYLKGKDCGFMEEKVVDIWIFFKQFGEMSPEEVESFLRDPNNGYELGKFFYRTTGQDKIYAYNGLGIRNIRGNFPGVNESELYCRSRDTVRSK